ncbi:MAG TPA: hypothetical protein VJ528_14300 [Geothrix sp.]|nr:hypothetical protein [Geothrix sp.]
MGTESIKEAVLPRGPEGLVPPGGWKEGEPLVSPEALAAVNQEVGRVKALDEAERVARGTAQKVVEDALDRDKGDKAGKLKAFKSFLWGLEELAGRDAEAVADTQETRLVFRLFRLDDKGGVKPQGVYQTAVSFSASEALALGDPDLEGRAQAWCEQSGRFGKYQWRLLGWAAGEQTLDTTFNVTTEPPPGYEPPRVPVVPEAPEPPKNPMENLKDSLGLVALVKDTLGLGGAGAKVDVETIKAAARAEALREADRETRDELRKLEDRWEAKLEAAKTEAFNRGVAEGRRAAEDEWRPKVWDLERRVTQEKEPSMLEEAVRIVGGPDVVQSIARAFIATANRPAPQARPVVPLQPRTQAATPAAQVNPAPVMPAHLPPEPTRAQWREAMELTEEALEVLEEHGDSTPEVAQLRAVLSSFVQQGQGDHSLGPWWQAWSQFVGAAVHQVLQAVEPDEPNDTTQGAPMDLSDLRTLLSQRLAEGATDEAILAELDEITTPEARAEWRGMLGRLPDALVIPMIDGDPDRIRGLLEAFKARK